MDREPTDSTDQQEDRLAALSPEDNALAPNGFAAGDGEIPVAHGHRKRTMGENMFDATTYVGLYMGGNEIAATAIVNQREKANVIGRTIRATKHLVETHLPNVPYIQKRFVWTTFALGGGMLVVPLVKILEDRKGKLVRMADSVLHGKRADEDPAIRQAHEEMDQAPRQTWSSLWKGRFSTIAVAYAIDVAFIWEHAWTSKLFKGTKGEKYSTLDAISNRIADGLGDGILKNWTAKDVAGRKSLLHDGVGLLSFSAALAAFFYGSSKLFAFRQEQKQEIKHAHRPDHSAVGPARDEAHAETGEIAPGKSAPTTRIGQVESLSRLENTPQPTLTAGA